MVRANFARRYDNAIFDAETRNLYDGSGFFNVGEWSEQAEGGPQGLGEAAARLVRRHLAVDSPTAAAAIGCVLDVGCGLGPATRMMAEHYPAALVLGVNLSPAQAVYAAKTAGAAPRFAAMDATELGIASGAVDRLHAVEAAFHFDTRLAFLKEAHRVLRPGGKLVLTDILFRRAFAGVPGDNLWRDAGEYRRHSLRAGFEVEQFDDLTRSTLAPFCRYLAANGRAAYARLLRRSAAPYCLVVLVKRAGA